MRLTSGQDEEYEGGVKIIYGPSGCGKTKLVMALMKRVWERTGQRALYLDREKSWISAPREMRGAGFVDRAAILTKKERTKTVRTKEGKKVSSTSFVTSDPIDDMYEFAETAVQGKYGVIVVDTLSSVGGDILGSVVAKDTSGSRKGTTRVNVQTQDGKTINHPTQADYGVFASVMDEWMRRIWPAVEGGALVVLVGHQKKFEDVDETTGAVEDAIGTIELPGKQVPLNLPKFADLMLRVTKVRRKRKDGEKKSRGVDYVFFPEGDGVWLAKDRLSVFDPLGETWTVPREEYDGPEEHSAAVAQLAEEVWDEWLDRLDEIRGGGKKRGKKGA